MLDGAPSLSPELTLDVAAQYAGATGTKNSLLSSFHEYSS
jgi:hypothetical protein